MPIRFSLFVAFRALLLAPLALASPVSELASRQDENFHAFQDAVSEDIANDFLITPGEGLPSLESLGLTSLDLLNKTLLEQHFTSATGTKSETSKNIPRSSDVLEKRQFDIKKCSRWGHPYGSRRSVTGCENYLKALGITPCLVLTKSNVNFCIGQENGVLTEIIGSSINGQPTYSTCQDVAFPVNQINYHCVWCKAGLFDCTVKGADTARGNKNMLVTIHGNWWP